MTEPSYGSVSNCIVVTSFLMAYLLILNKKKNFILKYGTGTFLALALFLILRTLLPYNFLFSHNILSKKILPPFFDVITYKLFGLFSLMDIFVCTWISGFLIQLVQLTVDQYRSVPSILLPDMNFSEKEAKYIIKHELEHFYHHDL